MQKLAHPKNGIKKVYHVVLDRELSFDHMKLIERGEVFLKDGRVRVDSISYIKDEYKNAIKVVIHSGKYRIVRRLFEKLTYKISKLDRVNYAGLTKKGLLIGCWRHLSPVEVKQLKAE